MKKLAVALHIVALGCSALCALLATSIQAQQPPEWEGRYMADTITHADSRLFPFAKHEPVENCSFLSLHHAEKDWGRWAMDVTAFETGTNIQATRMETGIYRVRGDSIQLNGFGWGDRGYAVAMRGDTLELTGTRPWFDSTLTVFSRWVRQGDHEHDDFEKGMVPGLLAFKFGCHR